VLQEVAGAGQERYEEIQQAVETEQLSIQGGAAAEKALTNIARYEARVFVTRHDGKQWSKDMRWDLFVEAGNALRATVAISESLERCLTRASDFCQLRETVTGSVDDGDPLDTLPSGCSRYYNNSKLKKYSRASTALLRLLGRRISGRDLGRRTSSTWPREDPEMRPPLQQLFPVVDPFESTMRQRALRRAAARADAAAAELKANLQREHLAMYAQLTSQMCALPPGELGGGGAAPAPTPADLRAASGYSYMGQDIMEEISHITALSQLIDDTQHSLHRCVSAVEALEEADMLYPIGVYKFNFRNLFAGVWQRLRAPGPAPEGEGVQEAPSTAAAVPSSDIGDPDEGEGSGIGMAPLVEGGESALRTRPSDDGADAGVTRRPLITPEVVDATGAAPPQSGRGADEGAAVIGASQSQGGRDLAAPSRLGDGTTGDVKKADSGNKPVERFSGVDVAMPDEKEKSGKA